MTIIEFINRNLSGIYIKSKDLEGKTYYIRFLNIDKNGLIEIESETPLTIGKKLQLTLPVKEAVIVIAAEVFKTNEKRYYLKTSEKAGILQRRKEKRYPAFKPGIYNNNKLLIIDISKSGLQMFSENDFELDSPYTILIDNTEINIIPVWKVYEEEIYRIGCKISQNSIPEWKNIIDPIITKGRV